MIDDLNTAIITQYNASEGATLRGLLTGGLWQWDEIPEEQPFPYIVFKIISDFRDDTFSTRIEAFRYQFSIFTSERNKLSTNGMKAIYEALITLYDKITLTVTSAQCVYFLHESTRDLDTIDGILHRAIDFKAMIVKT